MTHLALVAVYGNRSCERTSLRLAQRAAPGLTATALLILDIAPPRRGSEAPWSSDRSAFEVAAEAAAHGYALESITLLESPELDPAAVAAAIFDNEMGTIPQRISLNDDSFGRAIAVEILRLQLGFDLHTQVEAIDGHVVLSATRRWNLARRSRATERSIMLWSFPTTRRRVSGAAAPTPLPSWWAPRQLRCREHSSADPLPQLHDDEGDPLIEECDAALILGNGVGHRASLEAAATISRRSTLTLGATRVVTDRGLLPHSLQVGTTGATIEPAVLLSFGVSGASQHLGGVRVPPRSISVNTDASAQMNKVASHVFNADGNLVLSEMAHLLEHGGENDGE